MSVKLSRCVIESFVGDVVALELVSEESLRRADIAWSISGDAATLHAFTEGEYSFTSGVLISLVSPGDATVCAEYLGQRYTARVSVRPMRHRVPGEELHYYIGDLHDHTSMNHNPKEFATHKDGDITDYVNFVNDEALTDFGVISDHAGVTNDFDFFRGFTVTDALESKNVVFFPGAESEVMYAERDRFGILHRKSGEIVTFNSASYADVATWEEFYEKMSASPMPVAIFAHPHVVGFSTNGIWDFDFANRKSPVMLRMMRGIEMGNGADRKENLLHEYAYSAALDAGFRLSTTCSSDSHGNRWGYHIMPGKTVIMATEKSKEAFLDALIDNRFYATESGNVRLSYTVNGVEAPATLAPATRYSFRLSLDSFIDDPSTRPVICRVISDYGICVCEVDCRARSELDFTVESDTARYFYLRLTDSLGRKTWSMPIWCGREFDKPTAPSIEPIDMSVCRAYCDGVEAPTVINGDPFDTWYADNASASVVIDMGETRTVGAVGYYPHIVLRNAAKGAAWTTSMETAGLVSRYKIYTSLDGVSYVECASGTCQRLGAENIITFAPTEARYVRFDAVSCVGVDSELQAYSDSKVRIANLSLFSPV